VKTHQSVFKILSILCVFFFLIPGASYAFADQHDVIIKGATIVDGTGCKSFKGDIAKARDVDPLETIFDILVEDPETTWVQFLDRRGSDIMNATFLKHPAAMPSTDTEALPAKPEKGHAPPPVAYGLYPHYFGHYVRKMSIVGLEEAVKKATSLPAQRFGIEERGILKPGAFADIVLFDFKTIKGKANFRNPTLPPDGIHLVMVNGQIVYNDKTHTGAKPGKVLRRK